MTKLSAPGPASDTERYTPEDVASRQINNVDMSLGPTGPSAPTRLPQEEYMLRKGIPLTHVQLLDSTTLPGESAQSGTQTPEMPEPRCLPATYLLKSFVPLVILTTDREKMLAFKKATS